MSVTKESLCAAIAAMPKVKPIDLPCGLGTAYLRLLSVADAEQFLGGTDNRDLFAVKVLADENGERLFEDADVATVKDWPFCVKSKVWIDGGRFNGILIDPEASPKN